MSAPRDKLFNIMTTPGTGGIAGGPLRLAAKGASLVYGGVLAMRNQLYDRQALTIHDLGRPVVSVGNLSAGGTGKTPMVAWVCRSLLSEGCKPAVLMRGYKAVDGVSDEQQELMALLPGVRVEAGSDRVASAGRVLTADSSIGAFVLDDAFQHRRVKRDLNIVLVSATQGLSGGHVLPRGLLRERPAGLKRADLLVITRADQVSPEKLEALRGEIRRYNADAPLVSCVHSPQRMECVHSPGGPQDQAMETPPLFAVAGTGDPAAFERTLSDMNLGVRGTKWYADHHPYGVADVRVIVDAARAAGAMAIVTTGKDWAKLSRIASSFDLPVYVVRIEVVFPESDEPVVQALLRARVMPGEGSAAGSRPAH